MRARLFILYPHLPRRFTTSTRLRAGHSKWANIRHRKGAVDKRRQNLFQQLARQVTQATRDGGEDKSSNPALAAVISSAKASNAPSSLIDRAIARGMGRSLSGAALEKVMLEVVMPGGIAMVVEMETDSKGRTMQEVSHVVKKTGGKLGSTLFYFDHYGRVTLDADAARSREEDLFQFVLEEKALDLDIPVAGESEVEEDAVVWTKPGETAKVAKLLKHELGLQARSVDLVWRPNNDMKASLQSDQEATFLNQVLVALQDFPEVNATFVSVERGKASPAMWETIQENIIFR